MKRLTSWSQATAKPAPTALTVNAVMESAFMKLARLESMSARFFLADSSSPPAGSEPGSCDDAVEAPPAATGQRPSGKRSTRNRRLMLLRTLTSQQNPDEPLRCCPGHQTCLECPASPQDSRKVEEVDDNGDEVPESVVTRRDNRSARAPEPAAARPESLQLPDALNMFYGIECIDWSINALPVEE